MEAHIEMEGGPSPDGANGIASDRTREPAHR
jgi:hypothetical protein